MRNMTNADRDQIILYVNCLNMPRKAVAANTGWTQSAVDIVCNTFELVKSADWNTLTYKIGTSGYGVPCVEWAAERLNVKLPQSIYDAAKSRRKFQLDPEPKQEQNEDTNNNAFFIGVLQTLKAIQQSNMAIIDAISALAADLKDNNNINTDLICQRLSAIAQDVETLKNNTRKKGL